MAIREATKDDLDIIVTITQERRTKLAKAQPIFWNPSQQAAALTPVFFQFLIDTEEVLTIVHTNDETGMVNGFLFATEEPVPPVYDPGGKAFKIDDFALLNDTLWETAGQSLLAHAESWAKEQGGAVLILVAPTCEPIRHDQAQSVGYSVVTNWMRKTI